MRKETFSHKNYSITDITNPSLVKALTTDDINSILHPYDMFKGAYPCDLVPLSSDNECSQAFIVNTGKSHTDGQHWTGLIIQQKQCWFFDSFGDEILSMDLLRSLQKIGIRKYMYNSKQIQSYNTVSCGHFCIAFILAHISKEKFHNFLQEFSVNTNANENICLRLIDVYLSTYFMNY